MMVMMALLAARPEKRGELVHSVRSLLGEIRRQEGCLGCFLGQDVEAETSLLLSSVWDTRDSFDGHLRSDLFGALLGASSLLAAPVEIRFSAAGSAGFTEVIERARRQALGSAP